MFTPLSHYAKRQEKIPTKLSITDNSISYKPLLRLGSPTQCHNNLNNFARKGSPIEAKYSSQKLDTADRLRNEYII